MNCIVQNLYLKPKTIIPTVSFTSKSDLAYSTNDSYIKRKNSSWKIIKRIKKVLSLKTWPEVF